MNSFGVPGERGAPWSFGALLLACCLLACAGPAELAEPTPADPYLVVLGTAQDGGLPQIGCRLDCCEPVRADPTRRRLVASLLLADPESGRRWLIDATPDLPEQVERARGHPPTRTPQGPRPPLFEGILLTHGHMGHYSGLAQLGREAYGARGLPVYASPTMASFLSEHGPWELMVRLGQIELRPRLPGEPLVLAREATSDAPRVTVTPLSVPHRPEYSDTYAWLVQGPARSALYVPDIDKWHLWDQSLLAWLERVDVALVDGSFFADGEIPDRSMADIPHPFMVETLELIASLPAETRAKLVFTHLNHTNPAADPRSAAAETLLRAGVRVAVEGEVIAL